VDGRRCENGSKWKVTMKNYRMSLEISFVLELKGDERIDRDGLWLCVSFITIMEVRKLIYGEKRMSVKSDRMVEMISLHSIILLYSYVLFD